jgi:DNA-binding transcriptional ArsR family regulator
LRRKTCERVILSEAKDQFRTLFPEATELILRFAQDEGLRKWGLSFPSTKNRYFDRYRNMKRNKYAAAFKALAHPHRLTLFLRLARCSKKHGCDAEECSRLCVGELGKGLGIGAPTVSHHLKELTRAGLIRTRKRGQSTECWVSPITLDDLANFFTRAKA